MNMIRTIKIWWKMRRLRNKLSKLPVERQVEIVGKACIDMIVQDHIREVLSSPTKAKVS